MPRPKRMSQKNRRILYAMLVERDGERCVICPVGHNTPDEVGPLAIDHVDGEYTNDALWNLRLVCVSHNEFLKNDRLRREESKRDGAYVLLNGNGNGNGRNGHTNGKSAGVGVPNGQVAQMPVYAVDPALAEMPAVIEGVQGVSLSLSLSRPRADRIVPITDPSQLRPKEVADYSEGTQQMKVNAASEKRWTMWLIDLIREDGGTSLYDDAILSGASEVGVSTKTTTEYLRKHSAGRSENSEFDVFEDAASGQKIVKLRRGSGLLPSWAVEQGYRLQDLEDRDGIALAFRGGIVKEFYGQPTMGEVIDEAVSDATARQIPTS